MRHTKENHKEAWRERKRGRLLSNWDFYAVEYERVIGAWVPVRVRIAGWAPAFRIFDCNHTSVAMTINGWDLSRLSITVRDLVWCKFSKIFNYFKYLCDILHSHQKKIKKLHLCLFHGETSHLHSRIFICLTNQILHIK